jgi:putative nucleotidyltransferase with HDIG domain
MAAIALSAVTLVAAAALLDASRIPWTGVLILGFLCTAGEALPIRSDQEHEEISLTVPTVMAVMALYGFSIVVLVSSLAFVVAHSIAWASAAGAVRLAQTSSRGTGRPSLTVRAGTRFLGWMGRSWASRCRQQSRRLFASLVHNAANVCVLAVVSSVCYRLAGGLPLALMSQSDLTPAVYLRCLLAGCFSLVVHVTMDSFNTAVLQIAIVDKSARAESQRAFFQRVRALAQRNLSTSMQANVTSCFLAVALTVACLELGLMGPIALLGAFYMSYQAIQQTYSQLRSYRQTVSTLGSYMQRYHPYTQGHLRRVADLSERLASELALSPKTLRHISDAAMLHDIGKVGVSENVLDKAEELTDEEWEMIKQHPVTGAEIIRHLPFLQCTVDWVRYHHKWFDGSGYPNDGMAGEDIPIEAGIIAVADAFDAMTDGCTLSVTWYCEFCGYVADGGDRYSVCPRCGAQKARGYRKALTKDEAFEQLRRGVGTQFSPAVVKAFLRLASLEEEHVAPSASEPLRVAA